MGKGIDMVESQEPRMPRSIDFWDAFRFWLKLGFISFGGPAGQIAIMHRELVENRRWISEQRFLHALNYCMLLPGPEAQQLSVYIGWLLHRTWGGIVAGLLFILPSLFILIVLTWIYLAFQDAPVVLGIFYGIKPAVTAIVIHAAYRIGSRTLKNGLLWAIACAAFIAIFALKIPFPIIVAIAALIGYLGGRFSSDYFKLGSHPTKQMNQSFGPAVIDDDSPRLSHTFFRWAHLAKIVVIGMLLWLIPMSLMMQYLGWQHALTQMGWFFTKAALLTFGGAYAVLPYVYQGAVDYYQWLLPYQMIDGLALGETTPGPLIMVVTFVGFVAGWNLTLMGPDHLLLAGIIAGVVVTYFTFLPSFIFVLAGGPLVESTHGNLKFTAPLTAITAAVVGVIINLALFFAWHVLFPGNQQNFDFVAGLITLFAVIALFRFQVGVIPVLIYSGILGLSLTVLGLL